MAEPSGAFADEGAPMAGWSQPSRQIGLSS
jgi:hypothetical protein